MKQPISPDCRAEKHQSCTGDAWDDHYDVMVSCTCHCHREEPA